MRIRFAVLVAWICSAAPAPAAGPVVTPGRADAVYAPGEPVDWTITAGDAEGTLAYTVLADGRREIAAGGLVFTGGMATVTAKLDRPGTLLLTVTTPDKRKVRGGAAVAWERIKPSAPEPADFDAFWAGKKRELAGTPMNPVLEEINSGAPGVQLWKITLDGFRGSRIHGYLARPRGDAPAPAMLQLQYAGVYPLQKDWVVSPAKRGWLALNILPHDLPVDREGAFYAEQGNGPLKGYIQIGAGDREASTFLRMYLSCVRAADYLAGRADWNRATLLVQGGSQGGMQGVALAGLHPGVTVLTVSVPAGCDQTGGAAGRAVGFPWWVGSAEKAATSPYFDPVHFARRIRCPALVGLGLLDTISPPTGVFAMVNQIPGARRVVIMPQSEHQGAHAAYHAAQGAWWEAARQGRPVPLE